MAKLTHVLLLFVLKNSVGRATNSVGNTDRARRRSVSDRHAELAIWVLSELLYEEGKHPTPPTTKHTTTKTHNKNTQHPPNNKTHNNKNTQHPPNNKD
jgi:hypothetical protein